MFLVSSESKNPSKQKLLIALTLTPSQLSPSLNNLTVSTPTESNEAQICKRPSVFRYHVFFFPHIYVVVCFSTTAWPGFSGSVGLPPSSAVSGWQPGISKPTRAKKVPPKTHLFHKSRSLTFPPFSVIVCLIWIYPDLRSCQSLPCQETGKANLTKKSLCTRPDPAFGPLFPKTEKKGKQDRSCGA